MRALVLTVAALVAFVVAEEPKAPPPPTPQSPESKALPKLPAKDLPPRTRTKPDPAKNPFVREPVRVTIDERVKDQTGRTSAPELRVLESYIKEYFRRAGHPIVDAPAGAAYTIEGKLDARFVSVLRVLDRVAGYKYRGEASLRVLASNGETLESFELPEVFEENVRSEESAFLNLRRHMAKLLWDQITLRGKTFSQPEVVQLIGSLALQPSEGESATTEEVIARLADIGFPAVPHLLEALTDNRIVRIPSDYPGLKGRNLDDLRVFHIADKALEEIFQKVSRMSLDIVAEDTASHKLRFVITRGWENEWSRFCKPFADSPSRAEAAHRAAQAESAKKSAAAGEPAAPKEK